MPARPDQVLVVTLNPALDITHEVAQADWADVNRPHRVLQRAGGKGMNVARTLAALDIPVTLTGLAGGPTGQAIRDGMAEAGLAGELLPVAGETRRSFTVVDQARGSTAVFNEPGPAVSGPEWARFLALYQRQLARAQVVVLTGSLPPGPPPDAYAELTTVAAGAGALVVLDADGDALRLGVAGRPAIAKPNLRELERATGRSLSGADASGPDLGQVCAAAAQLRAAGAAAVVVSLGVAGLVACTGEGCWRSCSAAAPAGANPTGAGDAVVAALARGLVLGQDWPERLRHAAALGAAAAAAPVAGDFSQDDLDRLVHQADVTQCEPNRGES
jgi:tagatose 6-phosphate kinase